MVTTLKQKCVKNSNKGLYMTVLRFKLGYTVASSLFQS